MFNEIKQRVIFNIHWRLFFLSKATFIAGAPEEEFNTWEHAILQRNPAKILHVVLTEQLWSAQQGHESPSVLCNSLLNHTGTKAVYELVSWFLQTKIVESSCTTQNRKTFSMQVKCELAVVFSISSRLSKFVYPSHVKSLQYLPQKDRWTNPQINLSFLNHHQNHQQFSSLDKSNVTPSRSPGVDTLQTDHSHDSAKS